VLWLLSASPRETTKCRSLDSLRSLGMTRGSLRSPGMTGSPALARGLPPSHPDPAGKRDTPSVRRIPRWHI